MAGQDKLESCPNVSASRVILSKNQRIVETTRPLQHGATATTAPQHRDTVRRTGWSIDFLTPLICVAKNDKELVRLPHPQQFFAVAALLENF